MSAISASAPASPSEYEGEDSFDTDITEEAETEFTVSSEQPNLLAHPKVKSKCWQFFGFRTESDGTIVDTEKIVCKLCSTTLSYHGNTTNLAYHIVQ